MARSLTRRPPRGLRLTIAAAMALVAVAALVLARLRPRTDAERLATMGDDVREAVLRDLAREQNLGNLAFLSFEGGRDAPDAFLARVADLPYRVRKRSASRRALIMGDHFETAITRDRATGEEGTAVTIEIDRWISDDEVVVLVGCSTHFFPGMGRPYRWKYVKHSWMITKRPPPPPIQA